MFVLRLGDKKQGEGKGPALHQIYQACAETGHIRTERGTLSGGGRTIEIYDYDDGQYKDVEVESIQRIPGAVEIEVFDPESGEKQNF